MPAPYVDPYWRPIGSGGAPASDSVSSPTIVNDSVETADVKDNTLLPADLAAQLKASHASATAARSVSASGPLTEADGHIFVASGSPILTLPLIASLSNPTHSLKIKAAGGSVSLLCSGADTIEEPFSSGPSFAASAAVSSPDCFTFAADKASNRWTIV